MRQRLVVWGAALGLCAALLGWGAGHAHQQAAARQASGWVDEQIGGVTVSGTAEFRERTGAAIALLPEEWRRFVAARLTRISAAKHSGVNPRTGHFQVGRPTAFSWDDPGLPADSVTWYACVLVHEAQHVEDYRQRGLRGGRLAEANGLAVQITCMRDVDARSRHLAYLSELAGCLDEPRCQWWKHRRAW